MVNTIAINGEGVLESFKKMLGFIFPLIYSQINNYIAKTLMRNPTFEDLFNSKARIRVIKTLALNNELNITKIMKNTNLNHTKVKEHLKFLKNINFVQEKTIGRIKFYRYKEENLKAHCVKKLILLIE